jgi:3-phosphoshikimate 1-carboxyvinyltransferase
MTPRAVTIAPTAALAGRVALPPDKSVSHRTAILAALAEGESEVVGYASAADPQSTLLCLRALGVETREEEGSLFVRGVGLRGFGPPSGALDCGNAGTTMRLLAGVLAGQAFPSTLTGDASLSRRPMDRIAEPLRQMGARVTLEDGHAPVRLAGGRLRGIEYRLPVASAQVKSCVLLAGLLAEGATTVIEPVPTRDHTERMLGLPVFDLGGERRITVEGGMRVRPGLWVVPRDFSAAAFFLAAAAIVPNATIELQRVGLNPTRAALLDVLRAMGARIDVTNEREHAGEPIGDVRAYAPGGLVGLEVGGALVPNLIDELPVLAVAAACAEGRTVIPDAAELRHKETDRLTATAAFLRAMGAAVEEHADGLTIEGGRPLRGATVESAGDHRIAMAAAVAALAGSSPTTIRGADCVGVSFPGFWDALDGLAGGGVVTTAEG